VNKIISIQCGPKTGLFLKVDNFATSATAGGRNAYDMSKFNIVKYSVISGRVNIYAN